MRRAQALYWFGCALIIGAATAASARAEELPSGPGLAAKYPGDVKIGTDDRVLLAEDFEIDDLGVLKERWSDISNQGGKVLELVDDAPVVGVGKRSIRMTAKPPENTGGHLYTRLPRGVDRVFARFYVKFPADAGFVHHFVHLGGYQPSTGYPQGGAGSRPVGNDRMTVGIEPFGEDGRVEPPGIWNFYAYWPEMKISGDGRYWGNSIKPARPPSVPHDRWQCVEVMMQCNSAPDRSDGELALWLDGDLVMHVRPGSPRGHWDGRGFELLKEGGEPFEGFRWRTDDDLKINFFWLLHYVTDTSNRRNRVEADRPSPVQFDNIVVATEYIGPIAPPERENR